MGFSDAKTGLLIFAMVMVIEDTPAMPGKTKAETKNRIKDRFYLHAGFLVLDSLFVFF